MLLTRYDDVQLTCARHDSHVLVFWLRLAKGTLSKAGQYPSLADIAISEVRNQYKAVLKGTNWSELYKAIGLAAHGEGIGSFVYLRRVIERLVQSRFNEYRNAEGWNADIFKSKRMTEKVEYIGNHLPKYLVENAKLYGVFSLGIHELENDECLDFFDVGMRSIVMILEDDLARKKAQDARDALREAIQKFSGTSDKP